LAVICAGKDPVRRRANPGCDACASWVSAPNIAELAARPRTWKVVIVSDHREDKLNLARFCAVFAIALSCAAAAGSTAQAQAYPTRPIRLVVGFAPGGNTDVFARLLSAGVKDRLGQTVIIENKPAANGAVAAETVAKAEPDGYSL